MDKLIHGVFHFHSTYSHDGRSTLAEIVSRLHQQGFSFCIMTEHFEDFDPPKLKRYLDELHGLNRNGGFVLVPGVEINLSGIDTIIFPLQSYEQCIHFLTAVNEKQSELFSVLAHPSKYPLEKVARHLEKYQIDSLELWNQQADSSYLPPVDVISYLRSYVNRHSYQYLFGCDLHDVKLAISNVLSVAEPEQLNVASIVRAISSGSFIASNRRTGISYRNDQRNGGLDKWLASIARPPRYGLKALWNVRQGLRGAYRILPKPVQHSLNDFKNFVRNKV